MRRQLKQFNLGLLSTDPIWIELHTVGAAIAALARTVVNYYPEGYEITKEKWDTVVRNESNRSRQELRIRINFNIGDPAHQVGGLIDARQLSNFRKKFEPLLLRQCAIDVGTATPEETKADIRESLKIGRCIRCYTGFRGGVCNVCSFSFGCTYCREFLHIHAKTAKGPKCLFNNTYFHCESNLINTYTTM